MITVEEALVLHDLSINFFGGRTGVRDMDLLKSAVSRPLQTFDNKDVYFSVFEKATALLESIVKNHPFIDGNKRTDFLCSVIYLKRNHIKLAASDSEAYEFVIRIASSEIQFEEAVIWLEKHSIFIQ